MENQIEVPYHSINHGYGGVGGGDLQGFFLPGLDATANMDPNTLPWCLPSIHPSSAHHHQMSNSNLDQEQEPFCPDLRPFVSPLYGDTYSSRRNFTGLQLPNCAGALSGSSSDFVPGLMGMNRLLRVQGSTSSSSLFGTIHAELGKLTAQEIMDAKALAASKSHSEAERRRRERINGHLAKLRSMLPNTTKTDKASLLAEVIQYVKELKRQTSEIVEESPLPTEADELTMDSNCDEEGKLVVTASLCCDDRPDLLPDLISALKTLRLRVLKAEITTVGGRVKNVLAITEEHSSSEDVDRQSSIASIQEAFKTVMEQSAKQDPFTAGAGGATKRQRTTSLPGIVNVAPFN